MSSNMKQAAWENGKMDKVPSPMAPFKEGLWLLKILGLPLKCNEEATYFADKGRFLKCLLLTQGQINYVKFLNVYDYPFESSF